MASSGGHGWAGRAALLVGVSVASVVAALSWVFWRRRTGSVSPKPQVKNSLADELRQASSAAAAGYEDADELCADFAAASAAGAAATLSTEVRLALYGSFKQAQLGDAPLKSPWGLEAATKWTAWNKLRGLGPSEAMLMYIGVLDSAVLNWRRGEVLVQQGPSSGGAKQAMGQAVSRLGLLGEEKDGCFDETEVGKLCERTEHGDLVAVRTIVSRRAHLAQQRDKDGMLALHWAADRGHVEIGRVLLGAAADERARREQLDAQDSSGDTPLHYAIMAEQCDMIRLLISSGACPAIENHEGDSAAELARTSACPEVAVAVAAAAS